MKYLYLLLSILILSCSSEHSTQETDTKSKLESKVQDKNIIINSKVNSGTTLSSILREYNVEHSQILLISEQKEIGFNFNNLQLDKDYKIILNQDSLISSFIYYNKPNDYYGVEFSNPIGFFTTQKPIIDIKQEETLITMKEDNITNDLKNFLMGKFDPKSHPEFDILDKKYHNKPEMYLQKLTIEAFIKMREAAEKDGISLTIVSGTRDFYAQKNIWERKYKNYKKEGLKDKEIIQKIMLWSSMPSTSRHHWGTDIDINGFDKYFDGTNEKANKEYEWLTENAPKFGFCQVYSKKKKGGRSTGYNEEKWHWSYMPIANQLLEDYKQLISYSDITDFSACEFAEELNIFEEFVFGINQTCP